MAVSLDEPLACPTEQGRHRYLATDGYYRRTAADADHYPCTCTSTCALPCAGSCGCPACKTRSFDAPTA